MGNSFFKNKKAVDQKINKVLLDEAVSNEITRFSGDLMQDSHYLKQLYSYPTNIDFMLREFTIYAMEKRVALFYIPSMTDTKIIEEEIIKPLITTNQVIEDVTSMISASAISVEKEVKTAIKELNRGETLLLLEGETRAYIINTSKVEGRSVEKPQNETTLLGPKESFIESANVNISLIRKKIRSEGFMVEKMTIGERSNNEVFIVYNKELASPKVLSEVKGRIAGIQKDAVQNLSLLVQHIEDRKKKHRSNDFTNGTTRSCCNVYRGWICDHNYE